MCFFKKGSIGIKEKKIEVGRSIYGTICGIYFHRGLAEEESVQLFHRNRHLDTPVVPFLPFHFGDFWGLRIKAEH